jgi:HlyD family secretion protein
VAASLQAPVLFTIAQDLRDMQVEAAIDEADVGKLRVGQKAGFTVDAFPRREFSGEIRQIRKSPVNVQNVISYTVVISAANADLALLPGMTANVRVLVENRDSVLKVPNAALRFRPAPGRLWIAGADGKPEAVTVRTGLSDGTSTELVEGPLKEGDEVILGGGEAPAPAKKAGGPRMF